MGNTPPIWWPVDRGALQPVQPPVVHQPDPLRDVMVLPDGRVATRQGVLNVPQSDTLSGLQADVLIVDDLVEGGSIPPDAPVLEVKRNRPMQKLSRTMMRSFVARHLKTKQDGLCPLCQQPIDLTIKGEGVLDHDHDSGEIRGVLHRSCNAAEGKIANAAARWGAKSSAYSAIILYLQNLVHYLSAPGAGLLYPMHKTADEKRDDKNAKVRLARANAKAKLALRSTRKEPT